MCTASTASPITKYLEVVRVPSWRYSQFCYASLERVNAVVDSCEGQHCLHPSTIPSVV